MMTHQRGGEIRSDPNTKVVVLVNGGAAMGSRWRETNKHNNNNNNNVYFSVTRNTPQEV
jgi:hypothetical protein